MWPQPKERDRLGDQKYHWSLGVWGWGEEGRETARNLSSTL